MDIVTCEIPAGSVLNPDMIQSADFHDSYRAPLSCNELGIVDIFIAVFGHKPLWIKLLFLARNAAASCAGLETPTLAEIMRPEIKTHYNIGDKIGPWPIFALDRDKIVAGRNNRHMDFRLSVHREVDDGGASVTVSTICTVHNIYGTLYLHLIKPFHRYGVQLLMSKAVAANRL